VLKISVALLATVTAVGCASSVPPLATGQPASASREGEALALVAQAQVHLEDGHYTEALRALRRAVELVPENDGVIEEYGLALWGVRMHEEAIEQLRRVQRPSALGRAVLGMLLVQSPPDGVRTRELLEEAAEHLEAGLEVGGPEGREAHYTLIEVLLMLRRGEDAWRVLQALMEEQPGNPRLMVPAAQALRLMGRDDEAESLLRDVLAKVADGHLNAMATAELIELLRERRMFTEAAELRRDLIETLGPRPEWLVDLARLTAQAGDREGAAAILDELLAREGANTDALLLRARLDLAAGRLEAAERLYRKAIAANAEDVDARLDLARLLMETRHLDEARSLLAEVWSRLETAGLAEQSFAAEIVEEWATLEILAERYDEARSWLDRLPAEGLSRRGVALWSRYFRDREAFIEGLEWLTAVRPVEDEATARLVAMAEAEFRMASGDDAGAEPIIERLLGGGEPDVLAAVQALQARKRYERVVAVARSALARLGESADLRFALAASLERSGQWDEAVGEFRKVIDQEPDHAPALNYVGYMFADRNVNLEEARELIERAVALEPTSGAFQDSLGWVYYRLGDLDRAEKHLREAVRLEPDDATVHEHLGDLYMARGQSERAAAAYREALTKDSDEDGQPERIQQKLDAITGDGAR
jgi:tetratricopeptide (TPR) repeat protein